MSVQRFYKGRTNNHLTWVMVDATDFATPESALSAATTIKIYGKLRSATGTNFVSSGTGSLTNDITHVGASVLGTYTIALAKADLSDASAAWYDQYVVALSGTGAARQLLVVEGVIDDSNLSAVVSDLTSALLVCNSAASDAASAAQQANSRVLLNQSRISDVASFLVVMSDVLSDFQSDFQSRVPKRVATDSQLSDLASDLRSVAIVYGSLTSDLQSFLSDFQSDFVSKVPKLVANNSQLSDLASDIKSAVGAITVTVDASAASDIASAVWAHAVGTRVDSRILVGQSYLSDIRSNVSDLQSDFQSRVPKQAATASFLSDAHSDLKSAIGGITVTLSASDISDIASAVIAGATPGATASDIASVVWETHPTGVRVDSRLLVVKSAASDIYSLLSDVQSDFQSRVPKRVATDSQLSDLHSDLRSVALGLSAMVSDAQSHLSDIQSDFQSRVPKAVATNSQLSDLASDVKSAVVANGMQAAGVEPTAVFAHTDSYGKKIDFLGALARNKITQTAAVQSLRNDADTADIASAAVADDGATFTRDEFA